MEKAGTMKPDPTPPEPLDLSYRAEWLCIVEACHRCIAGRQVRVSLGALGRWSTIAAVNEYIRKLEDLVQQEEHNA